jgi:hypothetical protein
MTLMAWTWPTVWWLTTSAHYPSPLLTAHGQVRLFECTLLLFCGFTLCFVTYLHTVVLHSLMADAQVRQAAIHNISHSFSCC